MLKEATGPINFTMFLNLFGEKLHGTDPEDTILNAFKLFDPDAKGFVHKDELQKLLMTQADKFTAEEVKQMFQSSNIDAAGNLDYKFSVLHHHTRGGNRRNNVSVNASSHHVCL
ncbi:Myosin light chain 5 [Nibea albiflora]|uniref:Myosin light chain 5 n=1 Tax=Nibea albiflora TaxID=240163 RepID=A0ACB7F7I1_NIBAL|nr:Myosin light chain 5 [Nibea albiflora]